MDFQTAISDGLKSAANFYDSFYNFIFDGGFSEWMAKVVAYVFEVAIVFYYNLIKIILTAAVVVLQNLYESLNLTGQVEGYWMMVDPVYRGLMVFFHLPLILTMFISTFVVKRVLIFMQVL